MNFNELTPAETERLALLAEEAGEVVQIIGKILRHGYGSCNPFDENKTQNVMLLQKELGDLKFAVDLMCDRRDIRHETINYAAEQKAKRVGQYLHHQSAPQTKDGGGTGKSIDLDKIRSESREYAEGRGWPVVDGKTSTIASESFEDGAKWALMRANELRK